MLFVPRQVALASASSSSHPSTAAAMAKEVPKREKRGKSKAAKGTGASAAVVSSIAAFLESSGFPRTLAALQSEANLEGDAWRSSPVSLEDLFFKFLASSDSAPGVRIAGSNEQENTANGVVEEEGAGKKKKKKKSDAEAVEPESKASESSAPEKPSDSADGETKEKKQKKKKKDSSSVRNYGGNEANAAVGNDDQKTDGKKKKNKKYDKDEDVEARLDKVELAIKNKFEAAQKPKEDDKKLREEQSKSQNDDADKNGLDDAAFLDKGKKKKKGNSTSETSDKVDAGTAPVKREGKSNDGKQDSGTVEKGEDEHEKKGKKKRKKLDSQENALTVDKQVAGKDENNSGINIDKGEDGKPSADDVISKKRKLEEVERGKTPVKEDAFVNQKLNNGFVDDDTKEHSTLPRPNKRQKHSSEQQKNVNPFQRVKLDDVKFADERLQDNSYWAKGGADSGYGAKAQEILGQVRGRGFRHEKTKKKRGTYRGGQIDLQTHSIKFNNSDDDE